MPRPSSPADALLLPTATLRGLGLSLDIRCPCCWSATLPLCLMLIDRPALASVPLGRVLLRLRCQRTCRQAPIRVALLDAHEHAAHAGNNRGGVRPWELVLVGD